MKKNFLLLLPSILLSCGSLSMAQPTAQEATWVANNCGEIHRKAIETLAPEFDTGSETEPLVELSVGGELTPRVDIFLGPLQEEVVAVIIQATGESVCDQLYSIKRHSPDVTIETALARVRLTRTYIRESDRPAIRAIYQNLRDIRIRLLPADNLYAPGRSIDLKVSSLHESIAVTFSEGDPRAKGFAVSGSKFSSQEELAGWVRDLLEFLGVGP